MKKKKPDLTGMVTVAHLKDLIECMEKINVILAWVGAEMVIIPKRPNSDS